MNENHSANHKKAPPDPQKPSVEITFPNTEWLNGFHDAVNLLEELTGNLAEDLAALVRDHTGVDVINLDHPAGIDFEVVNLDAFFELTNDLKRIVETAKNRFAVGRLFKACGLLNRRRIRK